MNVRTIYRSLSFLTLYQIISNGLGFAFTLILVRRLSEFEFGVYSYIFSTLTIVSLFLESGAPGFFLRRWSVDPSQFAREQRDFLSIRILTAIPVSIALLGYVFVIDRFVSLEFLVAYVYFLFDALYQPHRILLTARSSFATLSMIDTVERTVSYVGAIVILLSGGRLLHVFGLFLVARVISLVLFSVVNHSVTLPSVDIRRTISFWKKALPLFTLSFFGVVYFRVDMLMIRYILGVESVATYSAAYKLMEAAVILPAIVMSVAIPSLSKLFATQSFERLDHFLRIATKYLSLLSLPFASLLILYSKEILAFLYAGRFADAAPTLVVLGLTTVVLYLTAPLTNLLFAMHLEKYQTKMLAVLTVVNIGLNLLLLPTFSIFGAAIATLLCEVIAFFFMQWKLRKVTIYADFLFLLATCAVLVLGFSLLSIPWMVGSLAFLLLFAIVLVMTKKLTLADLRTLEH